MSTPSSAASVRTRSQRSNFGHGECGDDAERCFAEVGMVQRENRMLNLRIRGLEGLVGRQVYGRDG